MSKPIKLARVHFAGGNGAHDPAMGSVPNPNTRRDVFTSEKHDISLADNVLSIRHRESGRTTLVPWNSVTDAVPEPKS